MRLVLALVLIAALLPSSTTALDAREEWRRFAERIADTRKCKTESEPSPIDKSDFVHTECTYSYEGLELLVNLPSAVFASGRFSVLALPAIRSEKARWVSVSFNPSDPCFAEVTESREKHFMTALIDIRTGQVYSALDKAKPKCTL